MCFLRDNIVGQVYASYHCCILILSVCENQNLTVMVYLDLPYGQYIPETSGYNDFIAIS